MTSAAILSALLLTVLVERVVLSRLMPEESAEFWLTIRERCRILWQSREGE